MHSFVPFFATAPAQKMLTLNLGALLGKNHWRWRLPRRRADDVFRAAWGEPICTCSLQWAQVGFLLVVFCYTLFTSACNSLATSCPAILEDYSGFCPRFPQNSFLSSVSQVFAAIVGFIFWGGERGQTIHLSLIPDWPGVP